MLALALVVATAAAAETPAGCGGPLAMADGWPVSSSQQQGLDPARICGIGRRFENWEEADPHGVVVARRGTLVYERYFADVDRRDGKRGHWVLQNARTRHDLHSMAANLVGLLVGIAFDRGWLGDIDAPVFSFFPEYAELRVAGKDRITLRHLLTMTSGLAWPETGLSYDDPANLARRMQTADDPYRFVLAQPLEAAPGSVWDYNSGGPALVGAILQKVSGRPLDRLAQEFLFEPLRITDFEWGRAANGEPIAAAGLRLRLRDIAKIGQLVLNDGAWDGRQVVSRAWIEQMTAPHSPRGWIFGAWDNYSYGYLWWLGRASMHSREIDWVGGFGWGGQRLYAVPSRDLVVAVTAGVYNFGGLQDIAGMAALNAALEAARWQR
jgi:CubicO group peptidase (beta-lactamase class C family)